MKNKFWVCLFFILLCFPLISCARTRIIKLTTGTGFYVGEHGEVITAAHVLDRCRFYRFKDGPDYIKARLIGTDTTHDLALLQTINKTSPAIATLPKQMIRAGDKVTVLGYPVEEGKVGTLRRREATFVSNSNKSGLGMILLFSESVKKGNSGGPLLDGFGNVVGVIKAKGTFTRTKYRKFENGKYTEIERAPDRHADIAIPLQAVKELLKKYSVAFREYPKNKPLSSDELEAQSAPFIVNVQCVQ